ncbi:MAG: hypothetical protein ACLQF0_03430 [Dissulfurispiraceae bacterium]
MKDNIEIACAAIDELRSQLPPGSYLFYLDRDGGAVLFKRERDNSDTVDVVISYYPNGLPPVESISGQGYVRMRDYPVVGGLLGTPVEFQQAILSLLESCSVDKYHDLLRQGER